MDQPVRRRRRWPIFVPFALVVAIVVIWTGLWFYASAAAETAIEQWRVREAQSGRNYQCGTQTIGGFPFRIEVRCTNPAAELRGRGTEIALKATDLLLVAQIYQPSLVIGEFTGPLTIAEAAQSPAYTINWTLGQSSVRGTPQALQRASLVFDNLLAQRPGDGAATTVLTAKRLELHGRGADGSPPDNPVIDLVLRASSATAPQLHPLTAVPLEAEIAVTLRGLTDLTPKPWRERFREMQARGGRLDITNARLQQGEVIMVSTGSITIAANGHLDGQLDVTVVAIEQVLKSLDVERMVSEGPASSALDRLDRLLPGLGGLARKNATPSILAGLDIFGKRTTLEGKPAVKLPLRFADGQILLGPFPIGRTAPLF